MIKLLKLTTSEEIIADVKLDTSNKVKLSNPVKIVLAPQGVGMVPFISPLAKEVSEITINQDAILYTADLEDEVYNAYNSKFGSGIVIPETGLQF